MNTRWADVEQVSAYADTHNDKTVNCRIYGHGWSGSSVTRHGSGFVVVQRCNRCRNRRSQEMDSRGYATPWRYQYVEGYLTEDMGRIDHNGRAVLRLAAIRNLTIIEEDANA